MADVRLIDVDITDRANGKIPVWNTAAGTHLYVDPASSGVPEGTSFPGSPTADDLFYRTDQNRLFFYDGTRWLTLQEFDLGIGFVDVAASLSASGGTGRWPVRQELGMYLTTWHIATFINGTSSGSAFWTLELQRRDAANASNAVASFSTGTGPDTGSNWVNHDQAINAVLDASTLELQVQATKTSTPGNLICPQSIGYRLIGT
jgi:hypothetical protein